MNTATDTLETNTPKSGGGMQVGQDADDLVGFWGKAPSAQPAALTAQLTTLTADAPGTPDYALGTVTTTSGAGFSTVDECLTVVAVIINLQARMAEVEARLEGIGIVAAN
jgi:hypothetical protein